MPAIRIRQHLAVLLGYICLALAFSWPLPLHLNTALLGPVSSDLGVYVWNLWVFRHELSTHGQFPFLTGEILSLTQPVPLTLHNYTPAANVVAFFLQPWLGTTATFNVLTLVSGVLAAYAMFLLARRLTGDAAAAGVAGIAFGFSPFLNARAMEHFSLVQVAPLPLFILCFLRLQSEPSLRLGALTGVVLAWAFVSDPYYAVYCVLIAALILLHGTFDVRTKHVAAAAGVRHGLTVLLVMLGGLIAAILMRGGGQVEFLGLRISMTQLYNPVLAFTLLLIARVSLSVQPRVSWSRPLPPWTALAALAVVCVALLLPVLIPMAIAFRNSELLNPPVLWRSSAPGVDLLSFLLPNPLHPWFGTFSARHLRGASGGFVENIASVPWTAVAIIAFALFTAVSRVPRFWLVFTAAFVLLALGPFVRVAGVLTYLPTPWAVLRYVPIVGAARMPTRFSIVVMVGVAVLLAYALRELRARSARPALVTAVVAAVLVAELLPAPRQLHSAKAPAVFRVIADDPRDVRVLDLPFGLRDGLSTYGDANAAAQFYQTVHEKPILGGYLSRLPLEDVRRYRENPVLAALLALSEGKSITAENRVGAIAHARQMASELQIGYVVVDGTRAGAELVDFAKDAFSLDYVAADGGYTLYRSNLPLVAFVRPFVPFGSIGGTDAIHNVRSSTIGGRQ